MSIPETVAQKLAQPLDPRRIHKREGGGGRQLSYLEGHDVIRTANDIFGVGDWSYQTSELVCLGEEPTTSRDGKQGFRVAYRAIVYAQFNGHGFSDVGYGDAIEYTGSKLTPHELAAKEAVTDALKRCLKNYGDQFGLCLYSKDAPEHRGATVGAAPARAAAEATASAAPAASGEFTFPSGKHAGKTLGEVPNDYLAWYVQNGPRQDVKDAILAFQRHPDAVDPEADALPF